MTIFEVLLFWHYSFSDILVARHIILPCIVFLVGGAWLAWKLITTGREGLSPTPQQEILRADYLQKTGARIVFDSNRLGTFGIFELHADGSIHTLADSQDQEKYPEPHPKGDFIVYARAKSLARDAASDVWMHRKAGGQRRVPVHRMLVNNGSFPTLSADARYMYFERQRRQVWKYDFATKKEKMIFPLRKKKKRKNWDDFQIVKPRVSPDGMWLAFTSDRNSGWTAWIANLKTGESKIVGKGCEPAWYSDGSALAWVNKHDALAGSAIGHFERASDTRSTLLDRGAPYGHEYYPSLYLQDSMLLHSACPPDQHDHTTSNYELFAYDIPSQQLIQLTFDGFTNRFPRAYFP